MNKLHTLDERVIRFDNMATIESATASRLHLSIVDGSELVVSDHLTRVITDKAVETVTLSGLPYIAIVKSILVSRILKYM